MGVSGAEISTGLMGGLRIFLRGFVLVFLTACNVYQVSHRHYLGAFFVSWLISFCWWSNARTSSHSYDVSGAGMYYATGAGCGTVAGLWLMTQLYW